MPELVDVEDLDGGTPYPVLRTPAADGGAGVPAWGSVPVVPGTPVAKPSPVFRKIEDEDVEAELDRLRGEASGG